MRMIAAALVAISTLTAASAQTTVTIARSGTQPSRQGPAENFTGTVRVDPLYAPGVSSRASGSYVTFDLGARSAWHSHPTGQTLIVTAGVGRVQQWGSQVEEIRPGDVVTIPPGVKHWHGASPTSGMTHIAIIEPPADGSTSTIWMEQVSDQQLIAPVRGSSTGTTVGADTVQQTRAQQLMGEFAPKLSELTDQVLYADVWARPGLSLRDRSVITVSALIAMNRPDQLRSHLTRARDNGVTQAEVVEIITHLAFYAGWPSAVTAVGIARDVFKDN